MIPSRRVYRLHTPLRAAMLLVAVLSAQAARAAVDVSVPMSRMQIALRLPMAAVAQQMRDAALQSAAMQPESEPYRGKAGIVVTVKSKPRPSSLALLAEPDGRLSIRLPIDISVAVDRPVVAVLGSYVDGCDAKRNPVRYRLRVDFVPVVGDGRLRYRAGPVEAVPPSGYRCEIGTNAIGKIAAGKRVAVDVASEVAGRIAGAGRTVAQEAVGQINRALPDEAALQELTRLPVDFGGAVKLGIDAPRIVLSGAAATGCADGVAASTCDYRLLGRLEGWPRLLFGQDWVPSQMPSSTTPDGTGFHLPATLLIPTRDVGRPDPAAQQVSGWLGDFRVRPVPGSHDLAVLQRRAAEGPQDLVWLSGGGHQFGDERRRTFDRPMGDVLDEILAWLDDPCLWKGVAGIPELRAEVAAFRRLLDRFQQDTLLPLDERGVLSFCNLRVDLRSLWVTREAVFADVTLTGSATLDLDYAL